MSSWKEIAKNGLAKAVEEHNLKNKPPLDVIEQLVLAIDPLT